MSGDADHGNLAGDGTNLHLLIGGSLMPQIVRPIALLAEVIKQKSIVAIPRGSAIHMHRPAVAVYFLALAFAVASLCSIPSSGQAAPSTLFHEDLLAQVWPGAEVKRTVASEHHFAWVEKQSGKYAVR